jgi:hypothetical protein
MLHIHRPWLASPKIKGDFEFAKYFLAQLIPYK